MMIGEMHVFRACISFLIIAEVYLFECGYSRILFKKE